MPEMITKYPDVALTILKDAHVACGEGKPQKILTTCPPKQFCTFPTGEMCIYSTKEISSGNQVTIFDVLHGLYIPFFAVLSMCFLGGILTGLWLKKKKRS